MIATCKPIQRFCCALGGVVIGAFLFISHVHAAEQILLAQACVNPGQQCAVTSQCCQPPQAPMPMLCSNGTCQPSGRGQCASNGQSCTSIACCQGLMCSNGTCQAPSCAQGGQACNQTTPCCSGLSCNNGTCGNPGGGSCSNQGQSCNPPGVPCCQGLSCNNGTCGNPAPPSCSNAGQSCGSTQCCQGLYCISGSCVDCVAPNQSCTQGGKACCGSGEFSCINNVCAQSGTNGGGGSGGGNPVCGNGSMEQGEQCEKVNGAFPECCDSTSCTLKSSGTVCRSSTDICDNEEKCTGSSPACPQNTFKPSSTICRAVAGTCDKQELCTGQSAACPQDLFFSAGTVCKAETATCHAIKCPGGSAACGTTCPNIPPTIAAISNQTHKAGDSVSVSVSASDQDGDTVTLSASGLPSGVTLNAGKITGKISDGASASLWGIFRIIAQLFSQNSGHLYKPVITADDGHGGQATRTFDFQVNPKATTTGASSSQAASAAKSSAGVQQSSTASKGAAAAVCGNGKIEGSEKCDDGNTTNNDGCSTACAPEKGWSCVSVPANGASGGTSPIQMNTTSLQLISYP